MFKKIISGLFSNAIFWIFLVLVGMLLFISIFEKYTSFGVDKVYNIF
jgi:hypothetical protein